MIGKNDRTVNKTDDCYGTLNIVV